MAVEAFLPSIGVVAVTALIDSINPCAIGVLILMLSVLLGARQKTKKVLQLGFAYIFAVFAVYLLAGLGLIYFFSTIPLYLTEYLSITVGIIIIAAGLLEIKDFFWYGRGLSLAIPPSMAKKLHIYSTRTTIAGVLFLGAFVSAVELPCTGAPYLAIITLLSQYFDVTAFMLLVLYNIIFVAPLIIILLLVAGGKKLHEIKRWKQKNRPYMRLFAGLLLVAMGWLLMIIANGTINFG
ncbi:MAG: GAP family protein [Candidatus Aenigmarchaeota archaeon]|nr:GAP family protein [Candidatus Aenigmarchaeota archaeon]